MLQPLLKQLLSVLKYRLNNRTYSKPGGSISEVRKSILVSGTQIKAQALKSINEMQIKDFLLKFTNVWFNT